MKSNCVYRDFPYEERTRNQIESAKNALQSLLNEWLSLQIGEISDIVELLFSTEKVYKKAIDQLVSDPAPVGRFAVKRDFHINSLELPNPTALYTIAKAVQQKPFCTVSELWIVRNGKIEINEFEAETLINAGNFYTSDPGKTKDVKDYLKLCDLYNSLNKRLGGDLLPPTPWTYNHFRGNYLLVQDFNRNYELKPDPEYIRKIVYENKH